MRKTLLIASVMVLILAAGGIGAVASEARHGDGPGMRGPLGPLGRLMMGVRGRVMTLRAELDLSEEQHAAIRDTIMARKKEFATAIEPAAKAQRALRDAVMAEKADDAAIRKAAAELGSRIGDVAVVVSKVKADVIEKAKITPEQIKKIEAFQDANDASVDAFLAKIAEQ